MCVFPAPDSLPLPPFWPAGPPEHKPLLPWGPGLGGALVPDSSHMGTSGAGLLSPLSSQHKATTFATTPRAPTSALPAPTLSLQNGQACCEKLLSDFSWGPISKPHMA